jgi:P-type Cu2+ transporter
MAIVETIQPNALGDAPSTTSDGGQAGVGDDVDVQEAEPGELLAASKSADNGERFVSISVPEIHCGGCIARIEGAIGPLDGVTAARVNLSTKRLSVRWKEGKPPPPVLSALATLGYRAHLEDFEEDGQDKTFPSLVKALAVAGFAAGNVMLLSVSIWSGVEGSTRDVFHWISAGITFPAVVYSGRVFFSSAWNAIRHGRTNMDVPISVGVILACGLSLHDTINAREHAYFDAAIMLLFFLLIGRTLDHMVREKARGTVRGLARLVPRGARVLNPDGTWTWTAVADIRPGMDIMVRAGDRIPLDGIVLEGESMLDCALVTGESAIKPVRVGSNVQSGTLNVSSDLHLKATAAAGDSFLAEMIRLMEAAGSIRPSHTQLSARVARHYTPIIHFCAILGFLGWYLRDGDIHQAITIAVAILIITCPCALGLAAPIIQVVASRRLSEQGVLVKDGAALERLATIDTVVFDKTGTLTTDAMTLLDAGMHDPENLSVAKAMARGSRHPHARALATTDLVTTVDPLAFERVEEFPGDGIEAWSEECLYRLGRADWACDGPNPSAKMSVKPTTILSRNGECLEIFRFDDTLRSGAVEVVAALKAGGIAFEIVSGDNAQSVEVAAKRIGVEKFEAEARPADKVARLRKLAAKGRKTLFVGDGLNDGPALRAAHVSMAPSCAADIGRNAADFVFLGDDLNSVVLALEASRKAVRMTRQNLTFSVLYNVIAVPAAFLGFVTPLIAALSMSGSSIAVVANALRLNITPARRIDRPQGEDGQRHSPVPPR